MKNSFSSFSEAYHTVVKDVIQNGKLCEPVVDKTSVGSHFGKKARSTRELIAYNFTVQNPRSRCYESLVRPANTTFNHANLIWTLTGGGDVDGISHYNPKGKLFAKDSAFYEAAFGARLFYPYQQLRYAEKRLREDKSSRRALSMIYVPEDTLVDKLDTPCAAYLHFMIREDRLICICNMRSQSALMVLPYDFFLFSMIHEIMAVRLEVGLGDLTYTSNSFHIYEDEFEVAEEFIASPCQGIQNTRMISASNKTITHLIEAEQISRLGGPSAPEKLDRYWQEFLIPIADFNKAI